MKFEFSDGTEITLREPTFADAVAAGLLPQLLAVAFDSESFPEELPPGVDPSDPLAELWRQSEDESANVDISTEIRSFFCLLADPADRERAQTLTEREMRRLYSMAVDPHRNNRFARLPGHKSAKFLVAAARFNRRGAADYLTMPPELALTEMMLTLNALSERRPDEEREG